MSARHKQKPSSFFDGPAIARCPTYDQMVENARTGSMMLKLALDYAGLRP